ncbi:hypothetical protein JCM37172_22830 [Faecalimonas hominis]
MEEKGEEGNRGGKREVNEWKTKKRSGKKQEKEKDRRCGKKRG